MKSPRLRAGPRAGLQAGWWLGLGSAWAAALLAVGCVAAPATQPATPRPVEAPRRAGASVPRLAGPAAMPARVLAELPSAELEVRLGRRGDAGLLVVQQDGRWWTSVISYRQTLTPPARDRGLLGSGKRLPEPGSLTAVGVAPDAPALADLEPVADGYLLAWLAPADGATEIRALALDVHGQPDGAPIVVTRSAEQVRWAEILPTARGALIVWELDSSDGRELRVEAWPTAKPSTGRRIAAGCLGWQAIATPTGAAVAAVVAEPGASDPHLGRPALWRIETDATVREPVELGTGPTAIPDVQVAAAKDELVVAWTDLRGAPGVPQDGAADPRVHVATVAPDGRVVAAPRALGAPLGEQALVGLSAHRETGRTVVAWEPQLVAPAGARTVRLELLGPGASALGRDALLDFREGTDAPQIVVTANGVAALTLAEAGPRAQPGAGTEVPGLGVVPTFVWLDATMAVSASEPVRLAELGEPGVPLSMRSLYCGLHGCDAIALGGSSPVQLALVELDPRATPWRPAARREPPARHARGESLGTIRQSAAGIADVSVTKLADGSELVAWLEQAEPAAEGAAEAGPSELGTLRYRFVMPTGELGPAVLLSERAIVMGGIDLEAVGPPATGAGRQTPIAVLAWVAPNNGSPQVFATSIGSDGKKIGQKAVTQLRAQKPAVDISDVAIARDGKGELVLTWADTRDGNAEIRATRIDQRLSRTAPERRLTDAPGPSTEPQVVWAADRGYLVWSDAREAPDTGVADIYLAVLDPKSLEKRGTEQRLFQSAPHSRSPMVSLASDGPVVSWIEDAVSNEPSAATGLRVMRLGTSAEPLASPWWIRPPGAATVRAATVGCEQAQCRVTAAWIDGSTVTIGSEALPSKAESADLDADDAKPALSMLGSWPAPAAGSFALGAATESLSSMFFVTRSGTAPSALRRLTVDWR